MWLEEGEKDSWSADHCNTYYFVADQEEADSFIICKCRALEAQNLVFGLITDSTRNEVDGREIIRYKNLADWISK